MCFATLLQRLSSGFPFPFKSSQRLLEFVLTAWLASEATRVVFLCLALASWFLACRAWAVAPGVLVTPPSVDFGSVPLGFGAAEPKTLHIQNLGGAKLRFYGKGIGFGEAANETDFQRIFLSRTEGPFSIADYGWRFGSEGNRYLPQGEYQTLVLAFDPRDTGCWDSRLFILTNDPEEPRVEIRVTGSAFIPGRPTPRPALEPGLTFPVFQNPENGHWYGMDFERRSWHEAAAYAQQVVFEGHRGYPATFTSRDELDWVLANVPFWGRREAWIGASQKGGAAEPLDEWEWVTGERWEFSNWGEYEPNESFPDEDCLMLWTAEGGAWNDHQGSYETVSIVEFGAPVPTPTPTWTRTPAPTSTPTSTFAPTNTPIPPFDPKRCDSGYYVLDSFGGRHRAGHPPVISGNLFFGSPLARDLERATDPQNGDFELTILDGQGAVHFIRNPGTTIPQEFFFPVEEDFPRGRAVDLVMTADSQGFWVLTDFAGIYRAGSAKPRGKSSLVPNCKIMGTLGYDVPYAEGRDPNLPNPGGASIRAVSLGVIDLEGDGKAEGYVILDSQGGHYQLQPDGTEVPPGMYANWPKNHPLHLLDPIAYPWPFFPGLDIARDLEVLKNQQGAVILDGWDGIHPVPFHVEDNPVYFATNRVSNSDPSSVQTIGLPYITTGVDDPTTSGIDEGDPAVYGIDAASIFTDLEFSAACNNGLYTMDRYGGVFALGTARLEDADVSANYEGSPYFFPFLYAEDFELFGWNESDFETGFWHPETCFTCPFSWLPEF